MVGEEEDVGEMSGVGILVFSTVFVGVGIISTVALAVGRDNVDVVVGFKIAIFGGKTFLNDHPIRDPYTIPAAARKTNSTWSTMLIVFFRFCAEVFFQTRSLSNRWSFSLISKGHSLYVDCRQTNFWCTNEGHMVGLQR